MKIESSDLRPPLPPSGRPQATAAHGTFGAMLQESLGRAPAAAVPAETTGVQLRPAIRALETDETAPELRVERFIDLLEDYRGQLADSRVTLKQLDPIVRSIEQGREGLEPVLARLPEGDSLRDIMTRALVTAETEIARYRRGDYLPA
jgi:exonuclease VII small subunit